MLPPTRFESSVSAADADAAVRATDSDASLARYSAVSKGYLKDPFALALAPRGARTQPPRPPLIHIGTHARAWSMDTLVEGFLKQSNDSGKKAQIVSLGAGSDTRFWRLSMGSLKNTLSTYIELDFSENTTRKAMTIRKSRELSAALGDPAQVRLEQGGAAIRSPLYHLLPADLRLPPSDALAALVKPYSADLATPSSEPLLNPSLPTLVLAECVLVYMAPQAADSAIAWFTDYFSHIRPTTVGAVLGVVVYEMFGLSDSFGRVMKRNLQARQVSLPGADACPNFASLSNRFTKLAFDIASARTLKDVRATCIPRDELARISKLEMLDEVEELDLVLEHYAVTWALKRPGSVSVEDLQWVAWKAWGIQSREEATDHDNTM